jgi:ankyrin repeat protein
MEKGKARVLQEEEEKKWEKRNKEEKEFRDELKKSGKQLTESEIQEILRKKWGLPTLSKDIKKSKTRDCNIVFDNKNDPKSVIKLYKLENFIINDPKSEIKFDETQCHNSSDVGTAEEFKNNDYVIRTDCGLKFKDKNSVERPVYNCYDPNSFKEIYKVYIDKLLHARDENITDVKDYIPLVDVYDQYGYYTHKSIKQIYNTFKKNIKEFSPEDLIEQIYVGNLPFITEYIRRGGHIEDINKIIDDKGNTLLLLASSRNQFPIVKYLVEHKANVNAQDKRGATALMKSIYKEEGMDPDQEIIEYLVKNGAKINTKDKDGETALIFASRDKNMIKILQFLIENGGDIKIKDNKKETALENAIINNNFESVELLISKGANINNENEYNSTPLLQAIGNTWHRGTDVDNRKIIELLISKGADVNYRDGIALIYGIENLDTIKLLVSKGVNINVQYYSDYEGINTPLMLAVKNENPEIVKFLIQNGAKINIKLESFGKIKTALSIAIEKNNPEIIRLLIENGAKISNDDRQILQKI